MPGCGSGGSGGHEAPVGQFGVDGYDPGDYPPFAVTVDIVVFTLSDDRLQLVLIQRGLPHSTRRGLSRAGSCFPTKTSRPPPAESCSRRPASSRARHISPSSAPTVHPTATLACESSPSPGGQSCPTFPTLAASFWADSFRISDLRRVYEIVWGTELEPGNFQRKVRKIPGWLESTGERSASVEGGRLESPLRREREIDERDV